MSHLPLWCQIVRSVKLSYNRESHGYRDAGIVRMKNKGKVMAAKTANKVRLRGFLLNHNIAPAAILPTVLLTPIPRIRTLAYDMLIPAALAWSGRIPYGM